MRNDFDRVLATGGRVKCEVRGKTKHRRGSNNQESIRARLVFGWDGHSCPNIKPFFRLLDSYVGKRWDDFYSDACRMFSRDTKYGRLFHEWIGYSVYTKSWRDEDGDVWVHTYSGPSMVKNTWRDCHYVDPEGILRTTPKRAPSWKRRKPEHDPDQRTIHGKEYLRIKGIWYSLQMKWVRKETWKIRGSMILDGENGPIRIPRWQREYEMVPVRTQKQLNRKELRKLGFRNDPYWKE